MSEDRNSMDVENVGIHTTKEDGLEERVLDFERQIEDEGDRALEEPVRHPPVRGGPGRKWTARDEDWLHMFWACRPTRDIAAALGRTEWAIFKHAQAIGLRAGCPQGFESIDAAARRTGFHRTTFLRLLRWAHVCVRPGVARPGSKGCYRIVEPADVDVAVAAWCALEHATDAARRHGLSLSIITALLRDAERMGAPEVARGGSSRWRVEPAFVDRLVAARAGREDGKGAAQRVGVSWNTLRRWLYQAGVTRPTTRLWFVDSAAVDRIVAEKRVTSVRAFRPTKHTQEEITS